jgi:hypothetical protein
MPDTENTAAHNATNVAVIDVTAISDDFVFIVVVKENATECLFPVACYSPLLGLRFNVTVRITSSDDSYVGGKQTAIANFTSTHTKPPLNGLHITRE